ncbi:MAG: FAD-dependent oxidoreductase [Clostridia bacterium]|nr:FAD-dependent oxidoreductase [Clostridia bacterium]
MKTIVSLLLSLCMLVSLLAVPAYADEVFSGVGAGKNGEGSIEVSVTLSDDGVITSVEVTQNNDDAGISDPAVDKLPAAIVEANSLAVDAVAGATLTSNGILSAVEAALVSAGLNPEDYKQAVQAETEAEKAAVTESTDVLVIGAGMAGLTAALAAKEEGASVVIIDKMSIPGGTTNLAGGILVCVDSELFADNRLDTDSLDSVMAYWRQKMEASGVDSGYPDWDRLESVVADTGKTVDWLVANGIAFDATPYAASSSYPMALANGGGAGLISMLVDACEGKDIDLRLNTKGVSLVTDESGAVVGAVAETDDSVITFQAKSVVLATGGISQNEELVATYSPKLSRAGLIPASAVSHTGDGFLMALEVGAGTFDVFATPLFSTMVDPALSALTDTSALTIYGQLGVNANGDRFGNEAVSAGWDTMDLTASDMIQDGNAPFWYVFDSSNEAAVSALEAGVESGIVAKGETIEELALGMHVYTANLTAAYEAYASAVAVGEDAEFGKDAAFLTAIDQAPFYAVKVYPTTFGSAGGVTTTEEGRVTRQDGTVISGLYAAGEMSNRYFYNENYILAASLGMYSTMGRRAGMAAAADALAQ